MDASTLQVFTVAFAGLLAAVGGLTIAGLAGRGRDERIARQVERITRGPRRQADAQPGQRMLVRIGRRLLWRPKDVRELAQLTHGAGFFSVNAPYRLVALQAFLAVACAVGSVAASASAAISNSAGIVLAFASGTVGYLLPRFGLRLLAAQRVRTIRREVPFFIDMLLLLLRSGLGMERCFREIEQLGHDAIPQTHRTIKLMLGDLEQGRSYETALDRWADRMADPSAREIARQLQQSLKHGTELSRTMSQLAQRLIEQRLAYGRELAGRRSTHMTVATLVFLMPPLIIILAAPGFSSVFRLLSAN